MANFGREILGTIDAALSALKRAISVDQNDNVDVHSGRIYEQGNPILVSPTTINGVSLPFNTWRKVSDVRSTLAAIKIRLQTDGTNPAFARVEISLNDDGQVDGSQLMTLHETVGNGAYDYPVITILVPPGAAYQVDNTADPAGGNSLQHIMEQPL